MDIFMLCVAYFFIAFLFGLCVGLELLGRSYSPTPREARNMVLAVILWPVPAAWYTWRGLRWLFSDVEMPWKKRKHNSTFQGYRNPGGE